MKIKMKMKMKIKMVSLTLSAAVILANLIASCGGDASNKALSLNDTASSKEVIIGKQVWMTENLNADKFCNGDQIPEAKTPEEWRNAGRDGKPAWCYYDNDSVNGEKFGKLYNWFAVNDSRGLAPKGWHIPSDAEWSQLTDYLGDEIVAGGKMKSTNIWMAPNTRATNSSGFSALPGGFRDSNGKFDKIGSYGTWWSSTGGGNQFSVWTRYVYYDGGYVNRSYYDIVRGLSVRCLRD